MAILTISGSLQGGSDARGGEIPAMTVPPTEEQALVVSGTSNPSQPYASNTHFIRVNCDVNVCLGFARPPNIAVAVAPFHRLGANETGVYAVNPGDMLAVISSPT